MLKENKVHETWSEYQFSFSKRLIIRIISELGFRTDKGYLVNFTRIGHLNITHVHVGSWPTVRSKGCLCSFRAVLFSHEQSESNDYDRLSA